MTGHVQPAGQFWQGGFVKTWPFEAAPVPGATCRVNPDSGQPGVSPLWRGQVLHAFVCASLFGQPEPLFPFSGPVAAFFFQIENWGILV